jgi:hypothetical protein
VCLPTHGTGGGGGQEAWCRGQVPTGPPVRAPPERRFEKFGSRLQSPGNARRGPLCPNRHGRIAQLVEQLTLNQRVLGSSPSASTILPNIYKRLEGSSATRRSQRSRFAQRRAQQISMPKGALTLTDRRDGATLPDTRAARTPSAVARKKPTAGVHPSVRSPLHLFQREQVADRRLRLGVDGDNPPVGAQGIERAAERHRSAPGEGFRLDRQNAPCGGGKRARDLPFLPALAGGGVSRSARATRRVEHETAGTVGIRRQRATTLAEVSTLYWLPDAKPRQGGWYGELRIGRS